MKIRTFLNMDNSVYRIVVMTEDWSQGDLGLMVQFGEPEIDVGGKVSYLYNDEQKEKTFGYEYLRIVHGFPYSRGFDSRDYDSPEEAVSIGNAWKDKLVGDIRDAVIELRSKSSPLPTEEISEV
jgi:hypothetical protein